jgi:hypothetical protein
VIAAARRGLHDLGDHPHARAATHRARVLLERPTLLALVCAALLVPLTFLGPGTDIDVANVLRAGEQVLDDGSYEPSRWPGALPHEVATAALHRLGGWVLVNLASLAFGALALTSAGRLLALEGVRRPGWVVLLVWANPWFWIAATSLGDYTWALGLLLFGAVQARSGRRVPAGLLFGLAIGMRSSTVLLVAAWLLAERTGAPSGRVPWRAVGLTAAVAAALGAAWFVPSWLAADRTTAFLDSGLPFEGLAVHLGRWAVKNLAAVGPVAFVVLLVGIPVLLAALRTWRTSAVVRFAVVGAIAAQLVYLRLPLKIVHLLPVVAFVALLAVASPTVRARWLAALVGAQLLLAVVSVTVAAPDELDRARSGEVSPGIVAGVVVNDVRCRLDDLDRGPRPDPGTEAAMERAGEAFTCQNRAWRPEP